MVSRLLTLNGCVLAASGKRTVSAALRVMGLGQTEQFQATTASSTVPFVQAGRRVMCCWEC